jgi:hypothetical protein
MAAYKTLISEVVSNMRDPLNPKLTPADLVDIDNMIALERSLAMVRNRYLYNHIENFRLRLYTAINLILYLKIVLDTGERRNQTYENFTIKSFQERFTGVSYYFLFDKY